MVPLMLSGESAWMRMVEVEFGLVHSILTSCNVRVFVSSVLLQDEDCPISRPLSSDSFVTHDLLVLVCVPCCPFIAASTLALVSGDILLVSMGGIPLICMVTVDSH